MGIFKRIHNKDKIAAKNNQNHMGFTSPGADNEAIRESRDTLSYLTEEVKKSNAASSKLNKSMLGLTFVMAVIMIMQFFAQVWPWLKEILQNSN